jgi:hypothetical protein
MRMTARRRRVTALTSDETLAMFELFARYYKDVSLPQFRDDLAEKDHVYWFTGDDRALAGFTTLQRRRLRVSGRDVVCLFSGDTVIDRRYWGTRKLQLAFFRYIVATKFRNPFRPVYWMLMSKGYKTYLLMRRNFPRSFPQRDAATPSDVRHVALAFYGGKFGAAYRPADERVVFDTPHGALRDDVADPPPAAQNDDVAFFVARNPRWAAGEELACIAEIQFRDLARHLVKYVVRRSK